MKIKTNKTKKKMLKQKAHNNKTSWCTFGAGHKPLSMGFILSRSVVDVPSETPPPMGTMDFPFAIR